jgi:Putative Ig domain
MPILRRRAILFTICAAVGVWSAAPAVAATSPPVWGSPVAFNLPSGSEGSFTSVSCTSAGTCVAVGSYENASAFSGLIAAEIGGTWGAPVSVTSLPAGARTGTDEDANLTSVSCFSATSCTAVGNYTNGSGAAEALAVPIALSGTTTTPGDALPVNLPSGANSPTLDSVSCSTNGSCTAVGTVETSSTPESIVATPGSSAWTATALPTSALPTGAFAGYTDLTAVSCPPSGACTAIGNYDPLAGGEAGFDLPLTGGAPGQATELPVPSDAAMGSDQTAVVRAISCPSAGSCTATGEYIQSASPETDRAFVIPIANGDPGTAAGLESPAGTNGPPTLATGTGISCSDATDCDLLGGVVDDPIDPEQRVATDSEVAGTWGQLTALPSDLGTEQSPTIDCTAASRCIIAGTEDETTGSTAPFAIVSQPQVAVVTAGALPAATVGVPYSTTLQSDGGTGTNNWSVSVGSLPAGLSLNATTGVISGTPTTSGQSGFIATTADPGPPAQTASGGLSITVAPAAPVTTPTTTAKTPTVGIAYLATSGTKATVVLTCSGAPCTGTLKVTGKEHLKGKTPAAVTAVAKAKKAKGKATTKTVTLASRRYSMSAGGNQTVTLTLSKAAAKLLKQLHKIGGELSVTPTGATKAAVIKTVTFKSTSTTKKTGKK